MQRSAFLSITAAAAVTPLQGTRAPDSALAREATELAMSSLPREIFNHCLRTYYFADLIGVARKASYDREALYIAAILHDMGLSPPHISEKERFEVDGANIARDLLKKYGIVGATADTVWDAITLHDNGGIARWKQAEVALVNAGVGADFGAHLDLILHDDVVAVLQKAPRTGFVPVFIASVAEVAKRKPFATGNNFVTDVAYRKVPGFHLSNFCDDVKDDPFAGYAVRQ
jgi:hypothetical protein